ncbi:MAG: hypothetical protein K2X98_02725 [Alphaproteobacteria bacterium]|nr:hypothetical protein [Alphaproteobacteria bacterium]
MKEYITDHLGVYITKIDNQIKDYESDMNDLPDEISEEYKKYIEIMNKWKKEAEELKKTYRPQNRDI